MLADREAVVPGNENDGVSEVIPALELLKECPEILVCHPDGICVSLLLGGLFRVEIALRLRDTSELGVI